MLQIVDVTYRIEGRLILEKATAGVPEGCKVGLVGRNGAGKSTLLKLIAGELSPESGDITTPSRRRLGMIEQEAPSGSQSLLDTVLEADIERRDLLNEAETATDPGRIAEIHERLSDIDAHGAPARAARLLSGLGFSETEQRQPCSDFSGGWRMRVALARLLFVTPDFLLLDEPTNYLDLEGTLWLEAHLRAYPHTVLVVSHDRNLLTVSCDHILHLEAGKLTLYKGNYEDFERMRRERQAHSLKLQARQAAERKRMEAFVERFRAKASKARQAQSRVKALAKLEPVPDLVSESVTEVAFPTPEPLPPPLVRTTEASVGYVPGNPVLGDLTFRIDGDDRIALLGRNGNGKSTLAKLIAGKLEAENGHLRRSKKMRIGYFAQHQLDELNPKGTPFTHMQELMGPEATIAQVRAKTGQIGFPQARADTTVSDLSGGEKARLLLGIIAHRKPHMLILDEPTNHLDVEMRSSLINALNDFEGAVILISHDRHLLEACAERLWLVEGGTVRPYEEDLDAYQKLILEAERSRRTGGGKSKGQEETAGSRIHARREAADRRRALDPLRAQVRDCEERMAKLTLDLQKLDQALALPGLYEKDPERATRYAKKRAEVQSAIDAAEEAWLSVSQALEEAEQLAS